MLTGPVTDSNQRPQTQIATASKCVFNKVVDFFLKIFFIAQSIMTKDRVTFDAKRYENLRNNFAKCSQKCYIYKREEKEARY